MLYTHRKYSNCCDAWPLSEVDEYNTGRCSACLEGAVFIDEHIKYE